MLARCQFGAKEGRCGATLTYPIKGYPWRNNVVKSYEFKLDQSAIDNCVVKIRPLVPVENRIGVFDIYDWIERFHACLTLEVSGRRHDANEDTVPIRSGPLDRIVRLHVSDLA